MNREERAAIQRAIQPTNPRAEQIAEWVRTRNQDECWVIEKELGHRAGEPLIKVKYRGKLTRLSEMALKAAGVPVEPGDSIHRTCGTEGCICPAHLHVGDNAGPIPVHRRGELKEAMRDGTSSQNRSGVTRHAYRRIMREVMAEHGVAEARRYAARNPHKTVPPYAFMDKTHKSSRWDERRGTLLNEAWYASWYLTKAHTSRPRYGWYEELGGRLTLGTYLSAVLERGGPVPRDDGPRTWQAKVKLSRLSEAFDNFCAAVRDGAVRVDPRRFMEGHPIVSDAVAEGIEAAVVRQVQSELVESPEALWALFEKYGLYEDAGTVPGSTRTSEGGEWLVHFPSRDRCTRWLQAIGLQPLPPDECATEDEREAAEIRAAIDALPPPKDDSPTWVVRAG